MSHFSNRLPAAALAAAISCSGCAGILFDSSRHSEIDHPVPRTTDQVFSKAERWACQPAGEPSVRATRDDFLKHWGEPQSRIVSGNNETWRYSEAEKRWCGVWLVFVVPIPLLLPICDTYDTVEFKDGIALHSSSRRFHTTGLFATIFPYPIAGILRDGGVTEGHPNRRVGAEPSPCRWPEPEKVAEQ